jgi:N-acetylneuraminic acid mutarotase
VQKRSSSPSAFVSLRFAVALLFCAAACSIITGTLPAFLRSEGAGNLLQRKLTFAERVAYQRGAGCTDDSWTTTSITKAPAGRNSQTAVWTGSEMIVWGGYGGSYFNTGGRYNPSTDSWSAISTINAPTARGGHTAVWTGNEMIVWGGDDGHSLNTGGRYNPANDTWTATSTTNAPLGRLFHTAVWTGSDMILWGGWNEIELSTGSRYNPSTDS